MTYNAAGTGELEPITREQLRQKIKTYGKFSSNWKSGTIKKLEVRRPDLGIYEDNYLLFEGVSGGLMFVAKKSPSHLEYMRKGEKISINEGRTRKDYQLIPTAKDITEDDLAKYVDGEFNCMWRTRKGLVVGKLSTSSDGEYVLKNPYLADKESVTGFSEILGDDELELEIPDNTVIVIEYGDARRLGKTAAWGVTNFASEDSVDIE